MASKPRSPYKTNWNKYEDAMNDVVRNEMCRVFQWLYQGGSKYVGDYLDEIPKGRQGLNQDEKSTLNRREPPKAMDITLLYNLLQRVCNLPSASDPCWTDSTDSNARSLEHTLYLIKKERNKLSHEGHKQEAQQMSDQQLEQKLNNLRSRCTNMLVEAARRCGRVDEEIVELNDKIEARLQEIRGVTSEKFVMMAKEEFLKTAQTKVEEWYQQPLLQYRGKPVTLDDVLLWRTPDDAAPAFILVTGEAGIGKSSLCRHVQECWLRPPGDGKDPLHRYQLVLHVRCRDVNTSNEVKLLKEELLQETGSWCSSTTLFKFLQSISTLWIFDGLDETTEEAKRLMRSLLGKSQRNCTVLVTARPEYGEDFLRQHCIHKTHLNVSLHGADPLETMRSIIQSKECDVEIKRHAKSLMEEFEELNLLVQQELRNPLKLRLTLQGWEDIRTWTFSQEFDLGRLYQKISETQIKSLSDSLSKGLMTETEATRKVEKWFLFLCKSAFKLVLCREVIENVIPKEMLRTLEDKCDDLGLSSSRCLSTFLSCPVSMFSSGNAGYAFCHDTQVHFLAARYVKFVMNKSRDLHSHTLKLFNIPALQEDQLRHPQLEHFLPVLLILVSLISGSASEAVVKMLIKLLLNAIPSNFSSLIWFDIAIKASCEENIVKEIGGVIPKEWVIFDDHVKAAKRLLKYSQPSKVTLRVFSDPEEAKDFEPLVCHLASLPVDMKLLMRHYTWDCSGKDDADKYLRIICRDDSKCVLLCFQGHLSDEGYSLLGNPKISDYCKLLIVKVKSAKSLETLCRSVRDFEFLQRLEVIVAMKKIPPTPAKLKDIPVSLCLPLMTDETAKDAAKFTARLCQSYETITVYDMTYDSIRIFLRYLKSKNIVVNTLFGGLENKKKRSLVVTFRPLSLNSSLEGLKREWEEFREMVQTKIVPLGVLISNRLHRLNF